MLVTSAQHVSLAPSEVFLFSVRVDAKQEHTPRGQETGCATQPGTQMTYYAYYNHSRGTSSSPKLTIDVPVLV